MSGHTEGPWEWDHGRLLRNVPGSHSETVLLIHDPIWQPMAADANLIAASPDLLEALKQLHSETLRFLKREGKTPAKSGPGRALYDMVEAAIAKAEGR